MSFKYAADRISDYEWLLERGVTKPISVFMNQNLYDQSEEEMWRQAIWATNIPSVEKIVITPDAHAGAGVPVGIVVATRDHIAPCAAGYDISCGMVLLKTSVKAEAISSKEHRRAWIEAVEERVACGMGTHQAISQKKIKPKMLSEILQHGLDAFDFVPSTVKENFECKKHEVVSYVRYKRAEERGLPSLGSIGQGNHFCELQQDSEGNVWVMIHTGSRGYGHQIATDFFNEGLEWWNSSHSMQLGRGQKELISFPVDSDIGKRYYNAMNQAANYAITNRFLIAMAVMEATNEVFEGTAEVFYEISHNLVQIENGLYVHRKGATRALPAGHSLLKGTLYEKTGHPILIPGSMGTSSTVLIPQDSEKSLYSVNHGCGRVMSRGNAKRTLNQDIVNKEMDGLDILCNGRNIPIDESLHCYKDIDEVINTVEGANLAKVSIKLYPRAVIKGSD
jgi:tRNA-splicing ligase RtcB